MTEAPTEFVTHGVATCPECGASCPFDVVVKRGPTPVKNALTTRIIELEAHNDKLKHGGDELLASLNLMTQKATDLSIKVAELKAALKEIVDTCDDTNFGSDPTDYIKDVAQKAIRTGEKA